MIDDAWLSLVERCVRDAEVAGSNPVASTYYSHLFEVAFLVPAAGAARRPQVRILSHRLIIEGVKYGEVPLPEKIFSKLTQKT